ncbi:hypothetical protein YC2023_005595 [Brassica napus]
MFQQKGKASTHYLFTSSVFPLGTHWNHSKPRILSIGTVLCNSNVCFRNAELCSCHHFYHGLFPKVPNKLFHENIVLKLENIDLVRKHGVAKVLGTLVSIGGATVITLYRGFPIFHKSHNMHEEERVETNSSYNWSLGWLYLMGHCLSWAGWMVLQAPVLKKYPAKLTLTSFTCFFGLVQFLVISLFVETDLNNWIIVSWEELFTILYAGIIASGLVVYLQTWCIYKGGPVFVAVFQPLQTLLVAAMAFIVLGDQLYSGRIVGAVFIMLGLYLVLWGKNEERRQVLEETSQQDPESLTKHLLEAHDKKTNAESEV